MPNSPSARRSSVWKAIVRMATPGSAPRGARARAGRRTVRRSPRARRRRSAHGPRGESHTEYSLGTYTRETDTVRWASISRASLRASSIGRTSERNTRPKAPSTRLAIVVSTLLSRFIDGGPRRSDADRRVSRQPCYAPGVRRVPAGRARRPPAKPPRTAPASAPRRARCGAPAASPESSSGAADDQGRRPHGRGEQVERGAAPAHEPRQRHGAGSPQQRPEQHSAAERRAEHVARGAARASPPTPRARRPGAARPATAGARAAARPASATSSRALRAARARASAPACPATAG